MDRFYAVATIVAASSALGPVHVAASSRGVVAVELLGTREGMEAGLVRRRFAVAGGRNAGGGNEAEAAGAMADAAAAAVTAALAGDAADLSRCPIDIDDRPEWDRLVLGAVRTIPRGATASYGEIARRIGRPGAARAVGGAVGRNPVGILVPCHRVIAGDGSLGGYGAASWGGVEAALDLKRALLALEGVKVRKSPGARAASR